MTYIFQEYDENLKFHLVHLNIDQRQRETNWHTDTIDTCFEAFIFSLIPILFRI